MKEIVSSLVDLVMKEDYTRMNLHTFQCIANETDILNLIVAYTLISLSLIRVYQAKLLNIVQHSDVIVQN